MAEDNDPRVKVLIQDTPSRKVAGARPVIFHNPWYKHIIPVL